MSKSNRKKFALDWITIGLYTAFVIFGWINIYGASFDFDQSNILNFDHRAGKQFVWILTAYGIGGILLLIDSKFYDIFAYYIYGFIVALLVVTIFIAPNIKGSHSWLVLGPISFQPAELAKSATALALAKYMGQYGFKVRTLKDLIIPGCILFLPLLCIILQKETGSALVFFSFFLMFYREGMSGIILLLAVAAVTFFVITIKYSMTPLLIGSGSLGIIICCAIVLLVILYYLYFKEKKKKETGILSLIILAGYSVSLLVCQWIPVNLQWVSVGIVAFSCLFLTYIALIDRKTKLVFLILFCFGSIAYCYSCNYIFEDILEPHQSTRIKVLLGIEKNLAGEGYNVNQSKIAIGSGGAFGKGFLNGTQTKLKYVPEQDTDFIFCTVGEEWGFIGSTGVLLCYLYFILRLIKMAERQREAFSRIYGYCVASVFFFHLAINVGMVIGLVPIIGIPLPFFSYGGSSLWGFSILLFIFLRLDAERLEKVRQI